MAKNLEDFAHPDYLYHVTDYKKIRDCAEGERAIKNAGTEYLPMLTGQTVSDYNNYKRRALFFPITGKTCSTLVGLVTTKRPTTVYPDAMARYFSDDSFGYQFSEFYISTFSEVVMMGRYGILIDAAESGDDPLPVPYIAENIIRWEVINGGKLVDLILREIVHTTDANEPLKFVTKTQYRRCYLDNDVYTVQIYDEDMKPSAAPVRPVFSGQTIDFVPFVCIGSTGVHMSVDRPPLLDIATINISHYMSSADLEWGRHIVGLPTPVVSGVDSSTSLKIGGTTAWVLPPAEAKAYYLEFLGQGLTSLEKALSEKIGLMASMSARMIDNSTRGSEAAETVKLRYMSEAASLIHIVNSVETGLNVVYNMLASLTRTPGTVSISFSREILGMNLSYKDLSTLIEAYLQGLMSKESLLYNLRRLDAVDPRRSDADELSAIRDPEPGEKPRQSADNV